MLQPWLTLRILRKQREAEDIFSFDLASRDGEALPSFDAGSHIDVKVAEGIVRQYSLCNSPDDRRLYRIAVLRTPDSAGGSRGLTERFEEGDLVEVGAPRNLFPLSASDGHSMLFAGGIGITPILCMAERLARTGKSFELHYAGRSRNRMAFLRSIDGGPLAGFSHVYCDDEPDQPRLDLAGLLSGHAPDTQLYVCGPTGFLSAVLDTAKGLGWPPEHLHREYFAAPAATQTGADTAFEVQVASTGARFLVPPERSVVSVLAEHGIEVNVSCEQGVCGTCLTRVLDGEPDHRDQVLTDSERSANDQFTPCCSRARTPVLVLDL